MNNRRKLVIALGAGALSAPFALFAQQQGKVWRIGWLSHGSRPASFDTGSSAAFWQRLRELGYVEGKNLVIERRYADNKLERLSDLAAELLRLKVDVVLVGATPAARVAQKVTSIIPIVMVNVGDPVASGFVKSLARPGGNITGLSGMWPDIASKYLQMLLDIVPKLSRVAVLIPESSSQSIFLKNIQEAAQKTKVNILPVEARTPPEIDIAFAVMARKKAGAVIMSADALFTQQQRQLAELTAKYRLPSVGARKLLVDAGILMSYGPNDRDSYRRAATYVDKIFKGAKPADLPVEQPTKFELYINGKTAKALGLRIPQSLLISADKVIE